MSLNVHCWPVGPFITKSYLVVDEASQEAILVDAGFDAHTLVPKIEALSVKLTALVNTHGHLDHVAGNKIIADAFGVPVYIHHDDEDLLNNVETQSKLFELPAENSPTPAGSLDGSTTISVGDYQFDLIHTPGHSPGSVCLYQPEHKFCIVGDTLFAGGVGRTDLTGGDAPLLDKMIQERLYTLPDETIVYPGHLTPTTIGREKAANPFVRGAM